MMMMMNDIMCGNYFNLYITYIIHTFENEVLHLAKKRKKFHMYNNRTNALMPTLLFIDVH
jgi:hypothetical protein